MTSARLFATTKKLLDIIKYHIHDCMVCRKTLVKLLEHGLVDTIVKKVHWQLKLHKLAICAKRSRCLLLSRQSM